MGLFSSSKKPDLDVDIEHRSSVRDRAEERVRSVFEISKPTLIQDAYEIGGLIETWSTKSAMARKKHSLTKVARDTALNDAKLRVRELFDGEKKVTNDLVESRAAKDPTYQALVKELIEAEEEFNIVSGKLSAAFTKASMLKGLLFALGKEMRVSDDTDLSSLPDLDTSNDDSYSNDPFSQ